MNQPVAAADWRLTPGAALRGELSVPGDKSISHRALMLAALAEGTSTISGFLDSADTRATAAILAQMGVRIDAPDAATRHVHGVGLHGLQAPSEPLDCGNSGTAMRLLVGLLCGQPFASELRGDASLSGRPMQRILQPLAQMGAHIDARRNGCAPLIIKGSALRGIDSQPAVASAQVKSAILMAGLYAQGQTTVREAVPTRDHTENMLAAMGWPLQRSDGQVSLQGGHGLRPVQLAVPGDFSSAAFFMVAATMAPGSDLLLRDVGMNARRTGLLQVLQSMGADIRVHDARPGLAEPLADLQVRHAQLRGVDVPTALVADMIDEFPVLFIAAAAAQGTTRIQGAAELRTKESDRIAVMAAGLQALGIQTVETADGVLVHGGQLRGGQIESHGDHRVAMSFAVAANIADDDVTIRDTTNVATSFPTFVAAARQSGLRLAQVP